MTQNRIIFHTFLYLILPFYYFLFWNMKKYQLWLQRKTYSQHLNNLIRIKQETSDHKIRYKSSNGLNRAINQHVEASITKDNSMSFLSPRDISYLITARELQNHKMRLVRSNQIVRQNRQMVKRLNKIKPFVSTTRPIDTSCYKLKRKMQRTTQQQNFKLKEDNYRQFCKTQGQNTRLTNKYQLTVAIDILDQRIACLPDSQISLELLAPQTISISTGVKPQEINGHIFNFTFGMELPKEITLKFVYFKGLNCSILSQFVILTPELGKMISGQWKSTSKIATLKANLTFTKQKPKFWNIKNFRV